MVRDKFIENEKSINNKQEDKRDFTKFNNNVFTDYLFNGPLTLCSIQKVKIKHR